MKLTRAMSSQSYGTRQPEFVVLGEYPTQDCVRDLSDIRERILTTSVWERLPDHNEPNVFVGNIGDVYDIRRFIKENHRLDVKTLRTTEGDRPYTGYLWVNIPKGFVSVSMQVERAGSYYGLVQHVQIREETAQRLIEEAGLTKEFRVNGSRVEFCGDMEAVRAFDVYRCCNNLTWGVHFKFRPNKTADWQEDWAGAHLPDEETADKVGRDWVANRKKVLCANLSHLKKLYPDHPVIPLVERYDAERSA